MEDAPEVTGHPKQNPAFGSNSFFAESPLQKHT